MKDMHVQPPLRPMLVLLPALPRTASLHTDWADQLATLGQQRTGEPGKLARLRTALRRRSLGLQAPPAHGLAERVFVLLILGSVAALWFSRS